MSFNTGTNFQRVKKDIVYRLKKVSKPPYYQNLYQTIVAHKSPKSFDVKLIDKLLGYLERASDGHYQHAIEILHSYRAKKDTTKDKVTRFMSDYGIGIYTLDEMILQLRIVPVEEIEPLDLPAGGHFIYVRNKNDVEIHLLDDNRNTLKVINCKIDKDATGNLADLYRNLKVLPWPMSRKKQTRRLLPSTREAVYGEPSMVFMD